MTKQPDTTTNTLSISKTTFTTEKLDEIYEAVFRESTKASGFCFLDMGSKIDSTIFRKQMVELKEGLFEICKRRTNQHLNYQWMGRFSHQHSSGFHRDSAAEHSILMLGYEPTEVDSKVSLADNTKLTEEKNISFNTYFNNNPEENVANKNWLIEQYSYELKPFHKEHYRLVILNNSRSFTDKTYGVFHRGEILEKLERQDRVINSVMLQLCDKEIEETHSRQQIDDFIYTDHIDR